MKGYLQSRHVLLDDSLYLANMCAITGEGVGEEFTDESKRECIHECSKSNKYILTLLASLDNKKYQIALDPRAREIDAKDCIEHI